MTLSARHKRCLPAGSGLPAAGYWPASLRSLTFLQSKSQALDVELRSCSLKDRRSFSFAELLLDVIANPPLTHNKKNPLRPTQITPQKPRYVKVSDSESLFLFPGINFLPAKVTLVPGLQTQLSTFWGKNLKKNIPLGQKLKSTTSVKVKW